LTTLHKIERNSKNNGFVSRREMRMKNWNSGPVLGLRKLGVVLVMVACLAMSASADVVHNVTASEGPDWVKVNIQGAHSYSVKHLPPGNADYRSIAIDLHGASIAGGLEPKAALPVDFGLVGQVRVRQMGSTVRVYIDVINWPEYQVMNTGGGVTVAIKAFQQRRKDPAAMY
jgi:hypothetical protein